MALFGLLMSEFDDEPLSPSQMNGMSHMYNFFGDPFGMMMGSNALTDANHRGRMHPNPLQMMPFGFGPMPSFGRLFPDFRDMTPNGNCHSFTSSSLMTMASGPDGRPQVYQETMSTTTAPGGVKETKKTVSDSRTGVKKMAIGHHIGDRAHILEQEQNVHSGEREERQEFINLDEDEAETFNNEWETRTRRAGGAIGSSRYGTHGGHRSRDHRQLALTDAPASRHFSSPRGSPSVRRTLKSPSTSKTQSSAHAASTDSSGLTKSANAKPSVAATTTSTTAAATAVASVASSSATVTGNRKREHTPDTKVSKKRHAVSDSDA